MAKSNKPVLGVRVGPASLNKLRQHTTDRSTSIGELTRRIIDEWLEQRQARTRRKERTAIASSMTSCIGGVDQNSL
jgi:hypothetical protein